MKLVYITLFPLFLIISSCTSVLDKNIDGASIEKDFQDILASNSEMDSLKINILEKLVNISKGRDFYLSKLKERLSDDNEFSLDDIVINEEKYNEQKDKIFNYFQSEGITYKNLLSEIDTALNIRKEYKAEAQEVYKEIDSFCIDQQTLVDEKESKSEEIKDELNEMVDLEIISIRKTTYNYRDVVEVKIKMTNKTSDPVEAISFDMEIIDKLGNKLATLGCRSNDRFVNSDIGNWTYEKWDRSEIYDALKNTKLSHITAQQSISKINLGGELISAYDNLTDIGVNYEYESPDEPYGYCPYLEEEDDLSLKLENLKDKREKEFKKAIPITSKVEKMTSKFLDFSKI